jgi:hypothetical protein
MDWINLAQDRDKWKARDNMILNLRVPQMRNWPSFMELVNNLST